MGFLEQNRDVATERDKIRDWAQQYLKDHPYGYQDENGVDLSLIAANLRLTPDDRVRQAQYAAQQLARMRDAGGS
jgi:hypothetical protein